LRRTSGASVSPTPNGGPRSHRRPWNGSFRRGSPCNSSDQGTHLVPVVAGRGSTDVKFAGEAAESGLVVRGRFHRCINASTAAEGSGLMLGFGGFSVRALAQQPSYSCAGPLLDASKQVYGRSQESSPRAGDLRAKAPGSRNVRSGRIPRP